MPFCSKCGTEVPENVPFCSKCGYALQGNSQNSEVTDDEGELTSENKGLSKYWRVIGGIGGSFALMFFAGWKLAWGLKPGKDQLFRRLTGQNFGEFVNEIGESVVSTQSIIRDQYGLLVKISDSYYGFLLTNRFFDAPVISWGLGGLGIYLLYMGISSLFDE